ncbi:hypothetical protein C7271_18515 [filamentous cyanobacterium CCP5]|nr:hypothetical protein C7271_18515 [filamentous cyanobacterium CCP5]
MRSRLCLKTSAVPRIRAGRIVHTLETAAEEYEAAIVDNQIVEVVEYQDSRGFVQYADTLYQTIALALAQDRPADHAAIAQALAALRGIWPSVNPPATPVAPPSEVYSLVSQVKLHS